MFTSDINRNFLKVSFLYFCVSLFLILFGAVYEYFSHGVYSYFMIYAFCIPLIFGALVYFIRAFKTNPQKKTAVADMFYGASIVSFTAGSIIKGVLDIYGTTNSNIKFYLILGIMLLIVASIYGLINHLKSKK